MNKITLKRAGLALLCGLVLGSNAGCAAEQSAAPPQEISVAASNTSSVYPVDPDSFADGPMNTRGANSVWRIGSVLPPPGIDCAAGDLFLLARPPRSSENSVAMADLARLPHASLAVTTDYWCDLVVATLPPGDAAQIRWHERGWEAPRDVGTITIVSIQQVVIAPPQLAGIVEFTTSDGGYGTFNLTTEQWNFEPAP